jgi:hypothetical protein
MLRCCIHYKALLILIIQCITTTKTIVMVSCNDNTSPIISTTKALRGTNVAMTHTTHNIRNVQQTTNTTTKTQRQPYYRIRSGSGTLGLPNVNAAIGNPLKGLAGGPRYSQQSPLPNNVPSAIEFYNIGLDEIMIGDNQFNWTSHDQLLSESASRKMHSVLSVYIHWPGRPLRLPPHLINLPLFDTINSGKSPNYGDTRLLTALQQFIMAWGQHIDGDTRIAAVHVGLLGFWGEGHTYPDTTLVPESSKVSVAQWYRQAFISTQVQARYPGPNAVGFGLYDGSLAYSTLDGASNGGKNVSWFSYRQMQDAKQTNSWKQNIMGGETRPELQKIVFTNTYPARTEYHQDYKECIDTLHISYALHHNAFQNGGYTGDVLQNANNIHAYMGYAFYVSDVAAYKSTLPDIHAIDVSVSITQYGVAPFYYDLSLFLECGNGVVSFKLSGVNEIIEKGETKEFLFQNIPATIECLQDVTLSLQSSYAYSGRPILFAQGTNGKVSLTLPLPVETFESTPIIPSPAPIHKTVPAPVAEPRSVPVKSPTTATIPTPAQLSIPAPKPIVVPIYRTPVTVPTIRSSSNGKSPIFRQFLKRLFPK